MADVTDTAFRSVIARYGKPDVFWTEFVSADGLAHPDAREKLLKDFEYGEDEHPIVAQIFGSNLENMKKAAALCRELGFDGVDINMGCPDKKIEKQGTGAAHIKDINHARDIISATREGAGDIPVTVKTRLGYRTDETDTWLAQLLELQLPVLTVHLRTRKEMSKVPAHWERMSDIVALRDEIAPETLILGNGDVLTPKEGMKKVRETGCDGVMIGKGIFGNPWLFHNLEELRKNPERAMRIEGLNPKDAVPLQEQFRVLVEHARLFEKRLGHMKSFAVMKKHFKAYITGFDGAKELRTELMEAENADEIEKTLQEFLKNPSSVRN